MPDDQPRIRAERKHSGMLPVFHALERIPLDLTLTPLEYEEIRYGIVPQSIEDVWFIFMEHNCLYFYTAYQGAFFCSIRFARGNDSYRAVEAWIQPSEFQMSKTPEARSAFMLAVLYKHLLHNDELSSYWDEQLHKLNS